MDIEMHMAPEPKFKDQLDLFMSCLSEAGCLEHIILIGSWAEYLYEKSGLLKGFHPPMKTIDLDFLIPDMKKPPERTDLVRIARSKRFYFEEDRLSGTSKFFGRDGFEIEFLVPQSGDGKRKLVRSNIGVNPSPVTHLDMLVKNLEVLEYNGYMVQVPSPEAYVLHKMVINDRRKNKAESDRDKINSLIPFLNSDVVQRIYDGLTKKEQKMFREYCNTYNLDLLKSKGESLDPSVIKVQKQRDLIGISFVELQERYPERFQYLHHAKQPEQSILEKKDDPDDPGDGNIPR